MEKYKILIDTDPGDDIDDALALAYVLSKECFEIVGITTTFKDTVTRAKIVKKICALAGKDIPVYYGYGTPLSGFIPKAQEINQATSDLDDKTYAPDNKEGEEDAVDFILESCKKYGKELILVGIGPLCNLSRALIKDERTVNEASRVVIMGGCFNSSFQEWNIYCDAVGASEVFTKTRDLTAVGVELTSQTKLTEEQSALIEKDERNELFKYIGLLVKMWRETHGGDRPTLHDILAICSINKPELIKTEKGAFEVDTTDRIGALKRVEGESVTYATSFSKQEFMDEFMSVWTD